MVTTPTQLEFVQEVPTATPGDTVPNAAAGNLILFSDGGAWYAKDSAGTVSLVSGISSSAPDGTSIQLAAGVLRAMIGFGGLVTAASKTYVALDRGKYYQRINGGAAMTDTLPTLAAGDAGYYLKVANNGTTVAETITFTSPFGTFTGGSTTYVLNFGCRQTFVWTGTGWVFDAGNGNIIKISPGTVPVVAGNVPSFGDTTGRNVGDSGIVGANVIQTTSTNAVPNAALANMAQGTFKMRALGAGTGAPIDGTPAQAKTALAIVAADIAAAATARFFGRITAGAGAGEELTGTQATTLLDAATSLLKGLMSAADKTTINNLWYDVTNYGVSTGNSGAANVAAMNTLIQTTAPAGATFFFPNTGANYPMTGTITVTQNYQTFQGTGMRSSVIFCANTTADLFVLNNGVRNITFADLGFWSTATATAGALLDMGTVSGSGNAQVNIYRCGAEGFGGNWFDLFLYNGTLAGLLCNIEDGNFNSFTHYGVAINCNTSIPSSVSANVIANTTFNGNINGSSGATAGIFVRQCGALQITNSDIIQCTNNLLVQPAAAGEIIASIYADNSYFDSSYGSCVKMAGSGPIVRCKFTSCSFTIATGGNYSAFEVNSTATNAPAGIDILNCSIQNTFNNAGTSNGLLLTTIADTKIEGCNISGFTNGIQVTPSTPAGSTRLNILGNTIGPAGGIKGNTVGILLNAGSTSYGLAQIEDCVFPPASAYGVGNGTNITDNSSTGAGTAATGQKIIANNSGLICAPPANYAATLLPITTVTNVDSRGGLFIPAAARPSSGRITVYAINVATASSSTITVKYGTANSNADATIFTPAALVGTAAAGSGHFILDWELLSSTTIACAWKFYNGNASTGMSNVLTSFTSLTVPATISTAASNWLGIYFAESAASVVTIRSVKYEMQSQ